MQKILTNEQMRNADGYTIAECGVSSQTLMERAGAAIADEAISALREQVGSRVLCVCGSGNNGGDGWCAARILMQKGCDVAVFSVPSARFSKDCDLQRRQYTGRVFSAFPKEKFDVVIDALFGTGFHGEPSGEYAEAIRTMNESGSFLISADVPSGLSGDGCGKRFVRADVTVAIGEYKVVHFTRPCGKVVRKDIGIAVKESPFAVLCEEEDLSDVFPPRAKDSHKGSFGKALIWGGSFAYTGAPLLSAAAALRCGCGFTQLAVPQELFFGYVGALPEAILTAVPCDSVGFRADEDFLREAMKADSVAFGMGCGVSLQIYEIVRRLLADYGGTLILDADALNSLSEYGTDILKSKNCRVVLTPHPKEFARLCGVDLQTILENGYTYAENFAKEYGVIVLLKGSSVFVTDGSQRYFAAEGTPALAKGGSGDVLSGIIAALCAFRADVLQNAVCAAFLLGRAGRYASRFPSNEYSVRASDVIANLPQAISSLIK